MGDLVIKFFRYDNQSSDGTLLTSETVARNVATMTPVGVLIPLDGGYHLIPWSRIVEMTSADDFGNILFV